MASLPRISPYQRQLCHIGGTTVDYMLSPDQPKDGATFMGMFFMYAPIPGRRNTGAGET